MAERKHTPHPQHEPALPTMVVLELSPQEADVLGRLLDVAVKSVGLEAAGAALSINRRRVAALQAYAAAHGVAPQAGG